MNRSSRRIATLMICLLMTAFTLLSPLQAFAEQGEENPPGAENGMADTANQDETTSADAPGENPNHDPTPDAVYTVRFFNWDNTQLGETQYINPGEAAIAPEQPDREGYRFTGWSHDFNSVTSNLDIHALFDELESYTITINYVFANSTLALQPRVFSVAEGGSLHKTVVSPAIDGYTADLPSITLALDDIRQDDVYTVTYTPAGDTPYRIEHYRQNLTLTNPDNPLDPANFTLVSADTQQLTGQTGAQVKATANEYTGFSPPAVLPTAQIAANGSTALRVYYTRNQYAVYFDTAGGSYTAPISALYEAPLTAPANPSRQGYTFTGWAPSLPTTMPAEDMNLTAGWQASGTVNYTVVYWLENITGTGYDFVGSDTANGTAGAAVPVQTTAASGITFPIASSHYTFDSTKTNAERPATISGDGTTIVNKYYNRNTYTLRFTFGNAYQLTVNGVTYASGSYTFTARYGAPIDTLWPGTPTLRPGQSGSGNFIGWVGGSTNYVTRQYYLTDTLINASPLAAGWSTSTRLVTVSYNFRNLEDTAYVLGDSQVVAVQTTSSTWNSKTFEGFTAIDASKSIENNAVFFNYTRNRYSITYYNGGGIDHETSGVPYQAPLAGYSRTPSKPTNVPAGYVFSGWYTTPQAYEGTQFNFAGSTMPAHNLILYAHWAKPQYTVTFQPANGSPSFTQQVYALDRATAPPEPTRAGYVFGGWYLSASNLHYVFSFPVSGNITLTARWVAQNNITYDVVHMVDGREYQRTSFGSRSMGESVTATALTIPNYLPDALSKSITLEASGNEIVFTYYPFEQISYTVRYLDAADNSVLHPEETRTTTQASVTENYHNIPGYYPNFYQQTLQLSRTGDNVLTFLYTKNADVNYTVRIFQENLGGGYTEEFTIVGQAPAGSETNYTPPSYTGFTYQPGLSIVKRVVASDGSTVLRLYYNRNRFTVNFTADVGGSLVGQTQFTDIQYRAAYGTAVTEPTALPQPGYVLDYWSPALPSGTDEITDDATYTAHFMRDDAQWATITLLGGGAPGTPFTTEWPIGTIYTLPPTPFTWGHHSFLGWDTQQTGGGASYGDEADVLITGNLTLYAQWATDASFSVVYLNNGGTGSVYDNTPYFENDSVTLADNAFSYPGYTFDGWLEADGVTRYNEGDEFSIVRNMVFSAQWKREDSLWASIVYERNSENATGSMDSEDVLINQAHTLPRGAFALANHRFTGWSTTPDGGGGSFYLDQAALTPTSPGTITLYAQWQENDKYDITYRANNPSDETLVDQEVYSNVPHQIFGADTFSYEHHDFSRWSTQPDGSGTTYHPGATALIEQDLVLYAQWVPRRLYEITYRDGFGSGYFEQDGYAEEDGFLDITVAANRFFRLGYDFVDWISDNGIAALPGTTLYDVEKDMVFTAEWSPTQYSISYDLDGGAVNGVNPTLYTIETPSFTLINPTRPGYSFEGWTGTTLTDESEEVIIGQSQIGDLAFTAHWAYDASQWSTITFVSEDVNKGSLRGTLTYTGIIGEEIGLARQVAVAYPEPVAATGYEFGSWSHEIPAAFPNENMVITAYFILGQTPTSSNPDTSLQSSSPGESSGIPQVSSGGDGPAGGVGPGAGAGASASIAARRGGVQTGDSGTIRLFLLLLPLSATALLVLVVFRRRAR